MKLRETLSHRRIDENITLRLTIPQFATDLFALTDRNREYLSQWLPWLNTIQKVQDTEDFIQLQLDRFARREAIYLTIFYRNRPAGVITFKEIHGQTGVGIIGYWLGEEFTGNGIMSKAVNNLVEIGFSHLGLHRQEIRCAVGNTKSIGIAERLGFTYEQTLPQEQMVNAEIHDILIYRLLRKEYRVSHPLPTNEF